MTDAKRVEIQLSKAKLVKLLIFSILFLIAGLWLVIKQPEIRNVFFNNPIVKNLAGYGGTLMGAIGIYFYSKKLFDKRPGLIIDEKGIVENATVFSFGLIPWTDIAEIYDNSIQVSMASKQSFITIGLTNPDIYIAREGSAIKRKLMELNLKNYGSPVHISTNGFEMNHHKVLELLTERFEMSQRVSVL